jgi:hypothetical protein
MLGRPITAVIVNHNGGELVLRCVRSLAESSLPPERIVVMDSCSTDGSDRLLEQTFPHVTLVRLERNRGYAAALNRGIDAACNAEDGLLLLMNNDVILAPDSIEILVRHWNPNSGLLGPKVFRLDDAQKRLDSAWGTIWFHHVVCHMVGQGELDSLRFSAVRRVDALLGCVLLTSCAVIRRAGLLDTDFFMYMEEIDFAYRLRRLGREVMFVPDAHAWHAGGHATRQEARNAVKTFYVRRNALLFLRKHGNPIQWFIFVVSAVASLSFFLVTFRWSEFLLRVRGYRDGMRADNTRKPQIAALP